MTVAATLARTTPDTRDRYVDLLRVLSLGVVILGHWLMIVITPSGQVTNLLALVPAAQPATWLLQVMPVFFLVGGFSHATALASLRRRGAGYADFVRARAGRLLRPVAVFAAAWLAVSVLVEAAGYDGPLFRTAARTVAQPLWFVGVYLALVLLAPPLWDLHRRLGRWAPVVPVGAGVIAAGVDALRFGGAPAWGYVNLLVVWAGLHQLGYAYADGSLPRRGRWLAVGGLAGLVAAVAAGPYPVSMVGVPGAPVSNMSPPTLALYLHGIWLTGLVLLLRPAATRWLRRPGVWRVVIAGNGAAMTAFLWHLTALVLVVGGALLLAVPSAAAGGAAWWLTRPFWLGLLGLATAILVAVFRAADRPRPASVRGGSPLRAALGGALCVLAVVGFSTVGFGGVLAGRTATMIVAPVTAVGAGAFLLAGVTLLLPRASLAAPSLRSRRQAPTWRG